MATNPNQLHDDLRELSKEFKESNTVTQTRIAEMSVSVARFAVAFEQMGIAHGSQLKDLEERMRERERESSEQRGALRFVAWAIGIIGLPTLAGVVYLIGKGGLGG